jgi:ABC-type glutathione transport system ATPase component
MVAARGESAVRGGGEVTDSSLILDVRNLTVRYPLTRRQRKAQDDPRPAVDDVSMQVFRGEIVGLVGESGSGKSSVAMAIMGLVQPQQGSITLDGVEIVGLRGTALRNARLGTQMVFQDPYSSLDPRQRIRSGFKEIRHFHPERTSWATNETVLELVHLDPSTLDRFPHQLSGGQIQRVVIARSLLLQPQLLIADEPTSALDVSVQAQILTLIRQLRDTLSLSVLLISHDLGVIRHLTTRMYVMKSGQIVESGETQRVMSHPQHDYTTKLLKAMPGSQLNAPNAEKTGAHGGHQG